MSPPLDDFWTIAVRERLVTEAIALDAIEAARSRGWSAEQTARDHTALNQAVIGIIQALQHPCDQVPGYELLSHLGHGGMGVVYKARQLAFNRTVALKTILVGPDANPISLQRFEQEAQTIGRLVHPHLVTAYDFSRAGGRYALAMEFLDGQDAEQWRETRVPSERVVWCLIRQAVAGLAHAAAAGVIHRDIKPSNLLLVPPPVGFSMPPGVPLLKVADFGLALLQDASVQSTRLTNENTTLGSPIYMAPEQLKGSRVDHRADIYAVGGTAYYLLTGQSPFEGLSMSQIYGQKLYGEPQPIETLRADLSSESVTLVAWLMTREVDQRQGDYQAILQRIDEVLPKLPPERDHGEEPAPSSAGTTPTDSPLDRYSQTQVVAIPGQTVRPSHPPVVHSRAFASVPELAATLDSPLAIRIPEPVVRPTAPRQLGRRAWIIGGVLITVMAVGIAWIAWPPAPQPDAAVPNWQPTGWATECYDGRTLTGWKVERGTWIPGVKDGEGATILAGSHGAISFPFLRPLEGQVVPLYGFRLVVLVDPHNAGAVEVQWALNSEGERKSASRYVVRLAQGQLSLGTRDAFHGPLVVTSATRDLPTGNQRYEIKLEQHGGNAWVFLNGDEVGVCPAPRYIQTPEFFLAAEPASGAKSDEPAWFSDIVLEELGPQQLAE